MLLSKYLDVKALFDRIREGYVTVRLHPEFPSLVILSYSRKAVYDNFWDDITMKCRGLIVSIITSPDAEIVARPFEKFFNLNDPTAPDTFEDDLPKTHPIVTEKLDGSLGILYSYKGYSGVASKGSFQSDHAEWATEWYRKHVVNPQWPEGYTVVFEMICQNVQEHIVHYDEKDHLVLLALINIETGEEADYNTLYHWAKINGLSVPKIYAKSLEQCIADTVPVDAKYRNEEGYVLAWPRKGQTPLRVKVKFQDFLRLQKLMHGYGPKQILELMEQGGYDSVLSLIENTPPRFQQFVESWAGYFLTERANFIREASYIYNDAVVRMTQEHGKDVPRKAYALEFTKPENKEYSALLFGFLDSNEEAMKKACYKKLRELAKDEYLVQEVQE